MTPCAGPSGAATPQPAAGGGVHPQALPRALALGAVSRVAGFAPNYFSALFKQREGMTFERYIRQLRIERAKQLLASTDLDMQRIAQLSGFGTRQYLARMLRRGSE